MKKFSDIVVKTDAVEYLNGITKKALLIYSPTSAEKINLFSRLNNEQIICISTHDTKKDVHIIENLLNDYNDIECVIGFGGGTAIDVAKYIGHKKNIEIVAIPSMLSTNVYSTDKVLMITDGIKSTLDSSLPSVIVYDEEILKLSLTENLYGFADVLTIYTASNDWLFACKHNNEKLDQEIYIMDIELVNDTITYILENSYEDIENNLYAMFNFIGTVGHITNLYGCGRPVSGSEHIFAKELEQRILVPHGISVAIGILIMSVYQSQYSTDVENCFKKLRIFDNAEKYKVTKEIVNKVFNELEPRVDRFSRVNMINKNDEKKREKINAIFERINLK